jgi:hypothetical protein
MSGSETRVKYFQVLKDLWFKLKGCVTIVSLCTVK